MRATHSPSGEASPGHPGQQQQVIDFRALPAVGERARSSAGSALAVHMM